MNRKVLYAKNWILSHTIASSWFENPPVEPLSENIPELPVLLNRVDLVTDIELSTSASHQISSITKSIYFEECWIGITRTLCPFVLELLYPAAMAPIV